MPDTIVVALGGLISSFLSGLLGVGGGIVLTPFLLYAPPVLGATVLPVKIVTGLTIVQAISGSVIGTVRHGRYGNVSGRLVRIMGPAGAVASFAGALVSSAAPDRLLVAIFAAFALVGAVILVLPERARTTGREDADVNIALALALAVVIGFFGGMVGIGAISFILAVLIVVLRVPPRLAIGTSLGIGLFSSVAALVGKAATAQIDPLLGAIVLAAAVVSAPVGAAISQRTHPRALMLLLAAIVFLSGVRMAWQAVVGG